MMEVLKRFEEESFDDDLGEEDEDELEHKLRNVNLGAYFCHSYSTFSDLCLQMMRLMMSFENY